MEAKKHETKKTTWGLKTCILEIIKGPSIKTNILKKCVRFVELYLIL